MGTEGSSLAGKFGFAEGYVVQEIGFDVDCDQSISDAAKSVAELVDETFQDIVDAVILWWRDDDGDLVDALVDALGPLADNGVIWLMTPKAGRDGHVEASDIADAAPTAGLQATSTINAAPDWQGTRLVAPKARR
ncbi:MAG: hypothetical protein RL355_1100 [Actinomycetota bacterium]